MSVPQWVETELKQGGAAFRERQHRQRFTTQEVAAEEHVSGKRMAKVVILMADDRLISVVVPAPAHVNLEAVRRTVGAQKCRLASEQEIASHFNDCEVGAIPPLRHWPDVNLLADRQLSTLAGRMCFQAGTHEDAIEMDGSEWRRIAQPRIGDFTTPKYN